MVGWGLNSHGQCGVPSLNTLLEMPEEIEALDDSHPISDLYAGHCHSAAVTVSGEVYLWGNGDDGRLGLGNHAVPVYQPERCEALVNHKHGIVRAALGRRHTYFLDGEGRLWGCGVTEGTSHSSLLSNVSMMTNKLVQSQQSSQIKSSHGFMRTGSLGDSSRSGLELTATGWDQQRNEGSQALSWHSMQLVPFVNHDSMRESLERSRSLLDAPLKEMIERDSAGSNWEKGTLFDMILSRGSGEMNMMTPLRLSSNSIRYDVFSEIAMRMQHEHGSKNISENSSIAKHSSLLNSGDLCLGLSIDSCGFSGKSIMLSQDGLPYMLCPIFERHGSSSASWNDFPAIQQKLVAPPPLVKKVITDHGGATCVEAGTGFFVALTRSGQCVIWMDAEISSVTGKPLSEEQVEQKENMTLRAHEDVLLAVTTGLPKLTNMATNGGHVHVTDGSSVWKIDVINISKSKSISNENSWEGTDSGKKMTPATATGQQKLSEVISKETPRVPFQIQRVLQLTDETIVSLSAGGGATAAVTDSGRLWLWGFILHPEAVEAARAISEKEGDGHWAYSKTGSNKWTNTFLEGLDCSESRWEGLGSEAPVVVPGLHKVKRVALGGAHALAELA